MQGGECVHGTRTRRDVDGPDPRTCQLGRLFEVHDGPPTSARGRLNKYRSTCDANMCASNEKRGVCLLMMACVMSTIWDQDVITSSCVELSTELAHSR